MSSALFFCSKFVCGSEADVVGLRLVGSGPKTPRAEGLRGGNGPVLVNLVLNFHADLIVLAPAARSAELGLIRQLVGNTSAEHDWVSLDAFENVAPLCLGLLLLAPTNDGFEGVAHIVLQLLVAAKHEESASHVGTSPVEGLGVVLRLVDELRPDLFHRELGVSLQGNTKVDLIGHLQVDLGLESDLVLLVALDRKLHKFI